MAYVRKHYGSWQSLSRIRNHPTLAKSFKSKTDAKRWANETELKIRREDAGIAKIKYPTFNEIGLRYIADVEAQQNKKWTYESWADGLEERTRPAKKAPVKIVKKPTVLELLEFEDYLNTLDPNYWIPEEKPKPKPEDKTRIIRTGITKLI